MGRELPYWLDVGTEVCEVCSFTYVVQVEYRCVGCDAALCAQCVVIVLDSHDAYCHACEGEEG